MKIIECPRDAMQGLSYFIPTQAKIEYLNTLLGIGFDTIDFGSFVSPKAIPQMRDTADVLAGIEWKNSKSKLLVIVANTKGAEEAARHEAIAYMGFPLSVSETFQKRNTNKSIAEALNTLEEIQRICMSTGKTLVTYISMGFGNPYNDPYDLNLVEQFADILSTLGVRIISLADTTGVSAPATITELFLQLSKRFPDIEFGAHLHSHPRTSNEKIHAAYAAGCRRFDGAIRGFGGCPMANDDLVGNIATESIVSFLQEKHVDPGIDLLLFSKALKAADRLFVSH